MLKISDKHYKIIVKQALANMPQESGGFLGGRDNVILAIMPTHNKHLYNRTDTFSFDSDDVIRAHEFFKKNNMKYICPYHSHPSGVAEPSMTDIKSGQAYHLIVGVNGENTIINAFKIEKLKAIKIPLEIIPHSKLSQIQTVTKDQLYKTQNKIFETGSELNQKIDSIKNEENIKYPKLDPRLLDSDFSTLA